MSKPKTYRDDVVVGEFMAYGFSPEEHRFDDADASDDFADGDDEDDDDDTDASDDEDDDADTNE